MKCNMKCTSAWDKVTNSSSHDRVRMDPLWVLRFYADITAGLNCFVIFFLVKKYQISPVNINVFGFLQRQKQVFIFSYLEWSQIEICRHLPRWLDDPKHCFPVREWFPVTNKEREQHFSDCSGDNARNNQFANTNSQVWMVQLTKTSLNKRKSYLFRYFVSCTSIQSHFQIYYSWIRTFTTNTQPLSGLKYHCWAQRNTKSPVWLRGNVGFLHYHVRQHLCPPWRWRSGPGGKGRDDGAARLSSVAKWQH